MRWWSAVLTWLGVGALLLAGFALVQLLSQALGV